MPTKISNKMKKIQYIIPLIVLALITFSCGSTKESAKKATAMQPIDINKMPEPAAAPEIKFKKPKVFTLDNGLTVIVVENHKLPRVNASLRIDNQPTRLRDKKGTDDLLGALLGSGSQKVSKDDFNAKIDFYGANVNIYESGFYINSLSKYFPEILQLTADQALHPKFTKEEFAKQQEQLIEGLKTQEKSTPVAADRVMKKLAYGAHPYGEFTTIETAKNVQLRDVDSYYKRQFTPNHAYLIIVGDVNLADIKKMTKQNFSDWKKAPQHKGLSLPYINNPSHTEVDFVHMPNAQQTELKVAHRSDIRMANPDYQKVLLMNSILGGDFNSYLNMTLREKHGWTYGARSRFGTNKYGDLFTASTSVRNKVADSAVVVTMEQINKIINEKVDSVALENNKQKYLGNFVLKMEKPATIANQAYNMYVNNLPEDYYETFLKKIEAVTVDDIQQMAKKYLHPDKARIVVAGNANLTIPGLKKAGYNVKFYDKNAQPIKNPVSSKSLPERSVKDIVDKFLQAIHYNDKLQSLTTVYEAKTQGIVITRTMKSKAPNKVMELVTGMGMTLSKQVYDGTKGYMEAQGQKKEMDVKELASFKNTPQPINVRKLYKSGKLERTEGNYYIITDEDMDYYFNADTGLLEKEMQSKEIQGHKMTQTIMLQDYKASKNGLKVPGKITVKNGVQEIEFNLKTVEENTVKDADFK